MLEFSANVGTLFTELPFVERFAAARAAGFTAVEFPYSEELEPKALAGQLRLVGIKQSLANMPYELADLGIASAPERQAEFQERLDRAVEYLAATGCKTLHVLAGKKSPDAEQRACDETLARNLQLAAAAADRYGTTIVVEAINRRDVPQFSLDGIHHAAAIVRSVADLRVRLLLDLYHVGTLKGNVAEVIELYGADAGYVQIAGFANRTEPDDDAANYVELLTQLVDAGYCGYVGCEYKPRGLTKDGLGWLSCVRHLTGK